MSRARTAVTRARTLALRFACAYFVLYHLPAPFSWIPGLSVVRLPFEWFWKRLSPWVAGHVLGLPGPFVDAANGSGDQTLDYAQLWCVAALAVTVAVVWLAASPYRPDERRLRRWLAVYLRYVLGAALLGYGMAKVFLLQFGAPTPLRLMEPYGDSSPMGLLWTFMGASPAYSIFTGAAEVLAAALLFGRRTHPLGALVAIAVLANVVALNFCYDVPVKLYSLNLLVAALWLAAPDLERLWRLLVRRGTVEPPPLDPPPATPRRRYGQLIAKLLFVGLLVGAQLYGSIHALAEYGRLRPRDPLYGAYQVERFTRSGAGSAAPWHRVAIGNWGQLSVERSDGTRQLLHGTYDALHNQLTITVPGTAPGDSAHPSLLRCNRPDRDHLVLDGPLFGDPVTIQLRRLDEERFLLLSRGFHWINEAPLNR